MSRTRLGRGKADQTTLELTLRDQRVVWRIAALLLDYPTQQTLDMLDALHAGARSVPAPAGPALVSFIDHARQ
ncbi:MAG: hypothetical protein WAK86_01640, partial [Pseudonocardiaceae bacterium]